MPRSVLKSKQPQNEPSYGGFQQQLVQAHDAAISGHDYRLAPQLFLKVWGSHFSREELHDTVAPDRTLARRLAKQERLTTAETDRAIRLARIVTEAERVFGDSEKAGLWLRRDNGALGGQAPLSLLKTEAGARAVDEILIRIDHGMYG